ncbi:S8 family serine peptidase [Haloarcula sp. S1CR25-12]|uniref:S8 family serine peptidase n=1 Tax=Haloarcula saliterrae TaxID=2950534 RepID=A0ABU2FB70_9EURY|nr:S8 family serine peptidase [Haloarcula sp. S1CR25-12]MDS0259466.1 S8 family serine peptidase [Haloarcula sp. S1CR25-12]
MADTRRVALLVAAVVAVFTVVIAVVATSTPPAGPPSDGTAVAATGGFERIHDRGLTGSNVSVGVVDVTGFNTGSTALSDQLRAARAFGTGSLDAGSTHGTAAATVVARIAPDSELYLASVGGIGDYERAVEWLRQQDVDVVVTTVSFYGRPGDGGGTVGRVTAEAVEDDMVVVAPSGNLATSHWRGTYDASSVENGTLQFADGATRTAIDGPTDVTVWLSWDSAHADEDYTVELYRTDGARPRLVARSQPYPADDTPNERIVADVSPGRYALVVAGPDEPTNATVRLLSPTHEFEHVSESGSVVAPGTGSDVLTVGAYNNRTGEVEPFSSRGPTLDGRTGVDVVAPNRRYATLTENGFVGSSAATSYVGGLVALLLDADPSLSPSHAELLVELTATDIGRPGVDYASGHGVVAPVNAVGAAANGTG